MMPPAGSAGGIIVSGVRTRTPPTPGFAYSGRMSVIVPTRLVTLTLVGGTPLITLPEAGVTTTEGWSVLNRPSFIVIDGPGEEGFILARLPGDAPPGWDDAIETGAGAWVQAGRNGQRWFARSVD